MMEGDSDIVARTIHYQRKFWNSLTALAQEMGFSEVRQILNLGLTITLHHADKKRMGYKIMYVRGNEMEEFRQEDLDNLAPGKN